MSLTPCSLCQPDDRKSCGACCGLYNYADWQRPSLAARLRRRTAGLRSLGRLDPPALRAFSAWVRATEPPGKLLETIYNCEYLGFVDPHERRVGCLLHPSLHDGRDLRDCSFYGADLCAGHFCLSYQKLTAAEKACVVLALDDWYLYGICVTDVDLCKSFFAQASALIGAEPGPSVLAHPEVRGRAAEFFGLKISWPFRSPDGSRFGKYCLAEDEYREARIDYEAIDCAKSPYDAIFLSLASHFESAAALRAAERIVRERIEDFARSCLGVVPSFSR